MIQKSNITSLGIVSILYFPFSILKFKNNNKYIYIYIYVNGKKNLICENF